MPFISFNEEGVCNYCENYRIANPKPIEELFHLLEPYRRPGNEKDCLVPFSEVEIVLWPSFNGMT